LQSKILKSLDELKFYPYNSHTQKNNDTYMLVSNMLLAYRYDSKKDLLKENK